MEASTQIAVQPAGTGVVQPAGQEVTTKVIGSKTVSSTKSVVKKTTKTTTKSSSSSTTTSSSSSSSSSQQQTHSETSKSHSASTSHHSTETSSNTSKQTLLIHSSDDSYNQAQQNTKPALQLLLPVHQATPTPLTPEDFSPIPGWMGELSFDVASFDKGSLSIQSDGGNIEVRGSKKTVGDEGEEKQEEYAKVCLLPESSIDPSKISSSLYQDGVMTVIVPSGVAGEAEEKPTTTAAVKAAVVGAATTDTGMEPGSNLATTTTTGVAATHQPDAVQTNSSVASTTAPSAKGYSKESCQASRSVVVKKGAESFSQIQITRSGGVAGHVSNATPLLPTSQQGESLPQTNQPMHFSVSGFESESVEVTSDGLKVEVKAVKKCVDEQGNERKEEFSRSYDLPAAIDPAQLKPTLSEDGVLSVLWVDESERKAPVDGDHEEVREEVVRQRESRQAEEVEGGKKESLHQQQETAVQHHMQSQSADGNKSSSKSVKSSSSSSSSSSFSSSTSHQIIQK